MISMRRTVPTIAPMTLPTIIFVWGLLLDVAATTEDDTRALPWVSVVDCETLEDPTVLVGGDEVESAELEVLVWVLLDVEVTVVDIACVELVVLDDAVVTSVITDVIALPELVVVTVWVSVCVLVVGGGGGGC